MTLVASLAAAYAARDQGWVVAFILLFRLLCRSKVLPVHSLSLIFCSLSVWCVVFLSRILYLGSAAQPASIPSKITYLHIVQKPVLLTSPLPPLLLILSLSPLPNTTLPSPSPSPSNYLSVRAKRSAARCLPSGRLSHTSYFFLHILFNKDLSGIGVQRPKAPDCLSLLFPPYMTHF